MWGCGENVGCEGECGGVRGNVWVRGDMWTGGGSCGCEGMWECEGE